MSVIERPVPDGCARGTSWKPHPSPIRRTLALTHGIDPHVYARRWSILLVLCLSLMIVIIGNTSLNVALPTLARDLDASTSSLQWMVDAYSLVFAGMLFTAGTLGDRFGRKGALQFGLVLFMAGALVRRVRRARRRRSSPPGP